MTKTPAQQVRERFKARRDSMDRTFKIPFVVDQELANRAEQLAREYDEAERRLAEYVEDKEVEEGEGSDLRADGTRADGRVPAYFPEQHLEEVRAELQGVVDALQEGSAMVVFRLATAAEYENVLAEVERELAPGSGGIDTSQEAIVGFGDKLLELCFVRVLHDGEDLGYRTWAEFAEDMQLTFGDAEAFRTPVVAKNRATGAFKLPFSYRR